MDKKYVLFTGKPCFEGKSDVFEGVVHTGLNLINSRVLSLLPPFPSELAEWKNAVFARIQGVDEFECPCEGEVPVVTPEAFIALTRGPNPNQAGNLEAASILSRDPDTEADRPLSYVAIRHNSVNKSTDGEDI